MTQFENHARPKIYSMNKQCNIYYFSLLFHWKIFNPNGIFLVSALDFEPNSTDHLTHAL